MLLSHPQTQRLARHRKTTLVSIAGLPPPCLGENAAVHLLKRLRPAAVGQGTKDVLRPGCGEGRCLLQKNALRRIFDLQAGTNAPFPALADRAGQDHLPLGRDSGDGFFGLAIRAYLDAVSIKPWCRPPSSGSCANAVGRRRPARPVRPCRTCRCHCRASCRCRPSRRGAWRQAHYRSAWRP